MRCAPWVSSAPQRARQCRRSYPCRRMRRSGCGRPPPWLCGKSIQPRPRKTAKQSNCLFIPDDALDGAVYLALCAGVAQKKGAAKEIDALAAPEHMDLAGPRLFAAQVAAQFNELGADAVNR